MALQFCTIASIISNEMCSIARTLALKFCTITSIIINANVFNNTGFGVKRLHYYMYEFECKCIPLCRDSTLKCCTIIGNMGQMSLTNPDAVSPSLLNMNEGLSQENRILTNIANWGSRTHNSTDGLYQKWLEFRSEITTPEDNGGTWEEQETIFRTSQEMHYARFSSNLKAIVDIEEPCKEDGSHVGEKRLSFNEIVAGR